MPPIFNGLLAQKGLIDERAKMLFDGRGSLLRTVIWVVMAGSAAILIFLMASPEEFKWRFIVPVCLLAISVASLAVLRFRGVVETLCFLVVGIWLLATGAGFVTEGVRTPILIAYPVILMFSGWILGRTAAVALFVASSVSVVIMAIGEASGFLAAAKPYPPLMVALAYVLILGLTMVMSAYLSQLLRLLINAEHRLTDEVKAQLQIVKSRETELDRHRHHLEDLVKERTAELNEAREVAEAASRAKSVFLANMSHELRTPMTGMMGMTDLALRCATDPRQIDWLNKSKSSAQHLLAVINDILDISKIESDRLVLENTNLLARQAIDEVIQMQEAAAKAKGLRIVSEVEQNVPNVLRGDVVRLKQILLNFISNAIKFSERGQINVRANIASEDVDSVLLRIEVADEGIGISSEQQAQLFNAFTQADASTTRKFGGTGLGLAISRRIAQLMGGNVGISSQEGRGSTFWATLRLSRVAASN